MRSQKFRGEGAGGLMGKNYDSAYGKLSIPTPLQVFKYLRGGGDGDVVIFQSYRLPPTPKNVL